MCAMNLASERVVIQSPLSFVGSARRIWKMTRQKNPIAQIAAVVAAVCVIAVVWAFVLLWSLAFGVFLVPYRLIRRGGRKRRQEALRHQEMLTARSG